MNQKNIKRLAVLDIDGTLIDSARKLRQDTIDAFERLGVKGITHEEIRSAKSWYELVEKYGLDKEKFDREFDKRKSWEQALRDGDAPLFEDTIPCLEQLASQGTILAALTRSFPEYTKAKLDYHGLSKYFKDRVAITPINAPSKEKEANQLIELVKRDNLLGKAYFVGDKAEDVTIAKSVQSRWNLNSTGIYLNRENVAISGEIRGYKIITSLSKLPEQVLK